MKTGTPERGAGGWGTIALPAFGLSVNPIPTRGADYAHLITTPPPQIYGRYAASAENTYAMSM